MESLYDFSVDKPLRGTVTLRIAMPQVTADYIFLFSHYREGRREAVPFTPGDQVVLVETDDLSLWSWLDMNVARFADWADEKIMTYADAGRCIDWYKEVMGISALMELNLESTPFPYQLR